LPDGRKSEFDFDALEHINHQPPPSSTSSPAQDDFAYEAEVGQSYFCQLEKVAFDANLKGFETEALAVEPYELIVPPRKRR
jgi:hypothetical protein